MKATDLIKMSKAGEALGLTHDQVRTDFIPSIAKKDIQSLLNAVERWLVKHDKTRK